jgi:hypothetical protein
MRRLDSAANFAVVRVLETPTRVRWEVSVLRSSRDGGPAAPEGVALSAEIIWPDTLTMRRTDGGAAGATVVRYCVPTGSDRCRVETSIWTDDTATPDFALCAGLTNQELEQLSPGRTAVGRGIRVASDYVVEAARRFLEARTIEERNRDLKRYEYRVRISDG